ncbi:hypothetical protein A3B45_02890 [Candidatus Daviesbacteria bacterium RIFCSPLOWO2_01_FULL_39_12]|uniref:Beta-lactamase class A catalytic domain-containing protein n=1 Tax=Candidatus Daviesbacteria bacterium RIFCSPLOWO2_01_FULL_39_12 TaxID=1797785 RepID=A0A1F5KSQ1_9BACT|nr:MAG: hypothetical protein A3D79_02215 [Candidatus Daviesbacteria bacterium RIFCSPHIGHO2_02_FULL_39_8]OGE43946.1 MAG: hypothetical protein A3B45_02890 [Candidatus Daviesbacteria bacterium RIFCSPLOWO2_01_FULL_39_12]
MTGLRKLAAYQKYVFFSILFIIGILLGSFLANKLIVVKASPDSKTLERKLEQFVKDRTDSRVSHISVYFVDLNDNFEIGINQNYDYDGASLAKLPDMMAILKSAQSDRQILSKTITFYGKKSDRLTQNILPENQLTEGNSYTVWELVERMIVFSDNQANYLLAENIGDIFQNVYADFGVNLPNRQAGQLYLTVKQYTSLLKALFHASYLNKEMSEKALGLLTQVKFKDGLAGGIPGQIKIAHKFGERSWDKISTKQLHDCGIIYYPDRPYLLCVMTRGQSFTSQSAVIKDLSSLIYNLIKI